jgi:hypothetical protein
MKNTLAENMLRFGSKNLSETSKKKLQRLAEQEETTQDPAVLAAGKLENDRKIILAMKDGLTAFVSPETKILYVPVTFDEISTEVQKVNAWGIKINKYTSLSSGTYLFPSLQHIGTIDVFTKNVVNGSQPTQRGIEQIKLNQVVTIVPYTQKSYDVQIIELIKKNDAPSWDIANKYPDLVTQFVDLNKDKLGDILPYLTMKHEITKGVFAKPNEFVAARKVIEQIGGNLQPIKA